MKGQLYINGKDAYTEWGVTMDTSTLSALMAPAPMKDYIEDDSRLKHGKSLITSYAKQGSRSITLTLNLTARTEPLFFSRVKSFMEELAKGAIEIRTYHQPEVYYRTVYKSCNQFTQFYCGIAKFSLKLEEPDPTNRSAGTEE